jgi:hypothetical protein
MCDTEEALNKVSCSPLSSVQAQGYGQGLTSTLKTQLSEAEGELNCKGLYFVSLSALPMSRRSVSLEEG